MDCSLPSSSVRAIILARMLEYHFLLQGSSWPRDGTCISCGLLHGRWILHHRATWKVPYGVRECFKFHSFVCSYPVFPAPVTEETYLLSIVYSSLLCHKIIVSVWVYFWALYSVPLIYIFMCHYHTLLITVALSEVREWDSFSSALFQDCFGYSGYFVFPYKYKKF